MSYKEKYRDVIPVPPLPLVGEVICQRCRLKCFYYCLDIAARTENAEATIQLINNTINRIEDDYSGVLISENPGLNYVGRMFPILDDYIDRRSNGSIVALTKGNKIFIEPNGSFKIISRLEEDLILEKI